MTIHITEREFIDRKCKALDDSVILQMLKERGAPIVGEIYLRLAPGLVMEQLFYHNTSGHFEPTYVFNFRPAEPEPTEKT